MSRYSSIILIGIGVLVLLGIGALFLLRSNAPGAPTQGTGTFPISESPYAVSTSGTHTKEEVQTAYRRQLPAGDTRQLHETAVVGDWALLVWTKDPAGGEALLNYRQGQWTVVAVTGGAFSVAGLRKEGVPQRITLALLDALQVMQP